MKHSRNLRNLKLTRVNPLVVEKVRTCTETFITVWAFVVPLTRVNSPVDHQAVFPCEGFGALWRGNLGKIREKD
jgi:hypothetical protein